MKWDECVQSTFEAETVAVDGGGGLGGGGGGAGRGMGLGLTLRRARGQASSTVNGERWLTGPLDRGDPSQLPSGLQGGLISSP